MGIRKPTHSNHLLQQKDLESTMNPKIGSQESFGLRLEGRRLTFRVGSDLKREVEAIAPHEGQSAARICEAFPFTGAGSYKKQGQQRSRIQQELMWSAACAGMRARKLPWIVKSSQVRVCHPRFE